MRNILNLFIGFMALSSLLFLNSCEEDPQLFEGDVVGMVVSSLAISEVSNELKIPIYNATSNGNTCAVTVELSNTGYDNPAIEGVDYTISTTSINFTKGNVVDTLRITLIDNDFYDKDKFFNVTIKSVSNNYTVSSQATCEIKITDNEHPLAIVLGSYSEMDYLADGSGTEGPYNVSFNPIEGNTTQVSINNFWGGGDYNIIANVDINAKTLTILPGQVIYKHSTYGDCYAVYYDVDANTYSSTAAIVCTFDDNGNITTDSWGAKVAAGFFGKYAKSELTKQ